MVELLDSNGDYAAWYAYDPNGRIVQSGGTFAASNPIGFSTQYTDRETGLVYYGLRFYSPDKGRFLNRDPIGEQGGANLYRFVGNNPVSRVDIWGLMTETECLDRGGYWDNGCVLDLGNFDVESDGKTLPSTGFNGSMAFLMSLTSQVGLRGAVVSTGGSGGTGDGNTDADDSDQKENSDCIEKARQKAQRAIANANGEYGLMRHQLEQDQRELHALNAGIARGEWGIKFGVTSAIALPIAWVAELALVAKTAPAVAGAKATLDATVAVGRAGGLGSATNPLIYEASLGYATALRAQSGARLTGSFIAGGAAANLNYSVGLSDSPWGPSDVATEFADSVIGGPAASLAMQLLSFPIEGAFDNSNVPGVNIAGATYLNRYNNAAKAFAADVEKCNE